MENKKIYSVTGLFDTPDDIIQAAESVSNEGYRYYDVNTPYPVHGMDGAMKLRPSTLGYVALVLGLTGTFTALFFMWWTSSIDYPNVIGGKPFFALPAFIPITFEVTVLLASVGTVLAMLFIFFKLPNNSHPLHDTDYMKNVSRDKFGVSIEAKDKKFDEETAKSLLEKLGANSVSTIYFDEEEFSFRPVIFNPKYLLFLVFVFAVVSGASYFALNKLGFMPPFNWMMEQDRLDVQSQTAFFKDGRTMRDPVEGTVARGYMPYEFAGMHDSVAINLMNPLLPTKENLDKGRERYNIFCSPCHGNFGEGDSRLRGQFPNPPSMHSQKLRDWTDGQIYHVITVGQNVMPSYASQLQSTDRWRVVQYVRALQRALNAKEEDLNE